MLNLKNNIKNFLCRSKYFVAIFLVLFLFVTSSFSVSASSHYVTDDNVHSFTGVPIVFDIGFSYTGTSIGSEHASLLFAFDPLFTDTSNESFLDYSEARSYLDNNNYFRSENSFKYSTSLLSSFDDSDLSFVPIDYSVHNEIVGSVAAVNQFDFSSFVQDLDVTSIDHFDLKASDFSCWIDDAGVVGTELFFGFSSFDYSSPDFDFGELRIGYSEYGNTDQITYVTLQPSEYLTGNDYLAVTPSLLGIDDYGTYIYITDLTLSFDYNRAASYLFTDSVFTVTTVYTFNPDLYHIAYGEQVPDNPSVPLLSYTEWIGTAVSGFMDLQIAPGFTLGGIFMTILAFVCVVWFLKLVAGG